MKRAYSTFFNACTAKSNGGRASLTFSETFFGATETLVRMGGGGTMGSGLGSAATGVFVVTVEMDLALKTGTEIGGRLSTGAGSEGTVT